MIYVKVFSFAVGAILMGGCASSPVEDGSEVVRSESGADEQTVNQDVLPAEGIACSAVEDMLAATTTIANPDVVGGLPEDELEAFETRWASLSAALSVVSDDVDSSPVLVQARQAVEPGLSFSSWVRSWYEKASTRSWGSDLWDSRELRAPGENWFSAAFDSHRACVEAGHISDWTEVAESDGQIRSFLPYGYWSPSEQTTDLKKTYWSWLSPTTTRTPGASGQLGLLVICDSDGFLQADPFPQRLKEEVSDEDLNPTGYGDFGPVQVAVGGELFEWVTDTGDVSHGLFTEEQWSEYRQWSSEEESLAVAANLEFLAGFDTVGLGVQSEAGQVTGQTDMVGFENVIAELERLGCWQ